MAERDGDSSRLVFRSVSKKGKGVIRRCDGSDDLWQIRCVYVDPDWSEPATLDFIRKHYCYEGAKCVVDLVLASRKRKGDGRSTPGSRGA